MTDEAVSTVVGTVLVLALVSGTITLYQLQVVPGLKEEAEAHHMDQVARAMANLDADLLRQLRNRSHAPLASPVPVTADTPAFVPDPADAGSLAFASQEYDVRIDSPSLTFVTRNGTSVLGGDGSSGWDTVQDGETVENVTRVIAFRLKLVDGTPLDEDTLSVQVTDAGGTFAGDLRVRTDVVTDDQGNDIVDLILRTREPPSPGTRVFHNHLLTIPQTRWDADYWIDPLAPLYWFDLQIQGASKPATLTFLTGGLDAEYKIAYREQVAAGLSIAVGDGETEADYSRAFPSGTLTYEAQNEFLTEQSLVVEHGALVRRQSDGAAFVVDPPLRARADGGVARIGLDVPSLEGDDDTVSAGGVATVRTVTTERERFGATAGELNLTWGTQSPELWADWLEDELTDAGLTSADCPPQSASSACQFEIQTTAETVRLEVHGPHALDADPSSPERDLALNLQRGRIDTEVQQ